MSDVLKTQNIQITDNLESKQVSNTFKLSKSPKLKFNIENTFNN